MVVLIKVLQLILALSILVIIHEFGHFIASRIFGVRVEKFYMFFDAKFSIFRCKKVNGRWHFKFFQKSEPEKYKTIENIDPVTNKKSYTYEPIDLNSLPEDDWRRAEDATEFGLGWIPLGGYCKIAGMVDESMDQAQMAQEPKPWEFRTKPAWQRLIIMVGGVFMNVVLAFLIYIGLTAKYGEQYLSTAEVNKNGIAVDSLGYSFGLRDGDKIVSIDGEYIENFYKIPMELILEKTQYIEVERDGRVMKVYLPDNAVRDILKHQTSFIDFRMPFIIGEVLEGEAAQSAGFLVGDKIIKLNDSLTPYYNDFRKQILQHKGEEVNIAVLRGNDTVVLPTNIPEDGLIGVRNQLSLNFSTEEFTFWQAIPHGFKKTFTEIGDYWKQLKLIFNPKTGAYESLGGFIAIGSIFPDSFQWQQFWRLTALLSIILAVMNILPIPGLDGGHVLFLLFEVVTRRKPSDKFLERATTIGFIFLLLLLIYANGNDIVKLFR